MSDQPTGQEATENAVENSIREILTGIEVAKSRRTNRLSKTEVDRFISAILPVLPTTSEVVSAEVISWYGIDRRNDRLYTGKAKTPILDKWLEDQRLDRKKVRQVRDRTGAYNYSFPRGIGDVEDLWVIKAENLPFYLTPEELAQLGIGGEHSNGTVTENDIAAV